MVWARLVGWTDCWIDIDIRIYCTLHIPIYRFFMVYYNGFNILYCVYSVDYVV